MAEQNTSRGELVKLTGLWLNEKNGRTYMSGPLSQTSRLLVFKNEQKKGNEPDYYAYLAPQQKKQQEGGER